MGLGSLRCAYSSGRWAWGNDDPEGPRHCWSSRVVAQRSNEQFGPADRQGSGKRTVTLSRSARHEGSPTREPLEDSLELRREFVRRETQDLHVSGARHLLELARVLWCTLLQSSSPLMACVLTCHAPREFVEVMTRSGSDANVTPCLAAHASSTPRIRSSTTPTMAPRPATSISFHPRSAPADP
jgi:hypothetical protein